MDLRDYPVPFLRCAAWGHHWETKGAFVEGIEVVQRWHCECGCSCWDRFTSRFLRFGQRGYHRPDGYSPVPTKQEARQEWFRRLPPSK